ncbi:uncharacterized protein LOC126381837 [Pectinophora gossypiella]|uniref:uncharacterized protein LOC126381837 n=1 Tax=Pectinophora gossypiella TaxID=13191 RepID=UPI00214F4DFB|nr:uncharacterized protein LOC126381837 [Pectinophora gossypiella]
MRAPPLLLLLLMAAAGLAVSPLARLNPWLSACDLEEEGASVARQCGGAACSGSGAADVLAGRDVAQLCALSAGARARRLAQLRMRACCERSPASALDRGARAHVLAGGERCERTLHDLLSLDAMVARVHCDFVNILDRYDCDQSYSVHTCKECQETYRRWACSTMVPLWVEEGAEEGEESGRARRAPASHAARWHARHLERVGHLDRRRAGGVVGRWVRAAAAGPGRPLARLKPCLSVCQLVEQHCPYFLPADRAPAYPTQYAGEPTFLCLDARIPETGGQANNSNYGSDECCYWYCEGRLCYRCEARLTEAARPEPETCSPVEERVPGCSVPYQAPSRAAPPRTHTLALTAPALVIALAAARAPRTHWTLSTSLVNVRDSRL